MKEGEIMSKITIHGLFRLQRKGTKTYNFVEAQGEKGSIIECGYCSGLWADGSA